MKNFAAFFLLILFSLTAFSQTQKPTPKNSGGEKEAFEKAAAIKSPAEKITALQKFIGDFPKSGENIRAAELIVVARATIADEKLRSGDSAGGIELFKLAVSEIPKPVSDKFFTEVVLQIPNNLFFRGERNAAVETAKLIEEKADGNAKQTLALATFYLGLENVSEAKRLADKAAQAEPNLPAVYQTLGLAHRLDFKFEEAAAAYSKALELDTNSIVSKRSLAEIKRALGKPNEAITLYREILSKSETDGAAQTGLILALFDAEKKAEAETEMQKSLAANPNDLFLLVGAAYWYAAHNESAKAIEFAQKAVIIEPRYTWAHIALARGLTLQKRLLEAEKTLLTARAYGNFPTLDYELASVRLAAGYYREAAEELRKNFAVKDNSIGTRLGGRVSAEAKSFTELLAPERRAGIFQFIAADNAETAERLKSLLDFIQKLDAAETDEAKITQATDEFVKGDDKMKMHRQLFAAGQLLERKKALPKVLELTKAAIGGVETALDVPGAESAVLADELYESRKSAAVRGDVVIVPEISRQTLSNILRGRIEDTAGWTLFQENRTAEAIIRLKRAVGILPENSAWWRTSLWRYGAALDADGKSKEALDAYIKGYTSGEGSAEKYAAVESLYRKINGNTDGLEEKIGARPDLIASNSPVQTETRTIEQPATPKPTPETKTEISPTPIVPETTQPIAETKPTPQISESEITTKTEISPTPETKTETVSSETKTEIKLSETTVNQTSENKSKSLFEPIIISVPKVEPVKKPSTETKPDETNQEKKPSGENVEARPRVVAEKNSSCNLTTSQENISIISNGGSLSVIVNFEGEGDFLKDIKATSSSPNDVEAVFEPEVGGQSNSAIFIIKSISQKTGAFTVTFESACGKKEIVVKVR